MSNKSKPRLINLNDAAYTPRFEYGDQAKVSSLCGTDDGSQLGVGVVKLTTAAIPWTIKYDEFILVLEGALTVTTESGELTASAMQAIWLPAGTRLTYKSDNAWLLYAIHPADWASHT